MAKAGYDPATAPKFWNRFGNLKQTERPEFLSTHPADQRRAQDLLALMDQANSLYQAAPKQARIGETI
jgi:predicted Zn-dependent protease